VKKKLARDADGFEMVSKRKCNTRRKRFHPSQPKIPTNKKIETLKPTQ
jgi:hypothetical protein